MSDKIQRLKKEIYNLKEEVQIREATFQELSAKEYQAQAHRIFNIFKESFLKDFEASNPESGRVIGKGDDRY